MHEDLHKHGLYKCYGWSYDACKEPSKWLRIDRWRDGSWSAYSLCNAHAREAFDSMDSEYNAPLSSTWWGIYEFAAFGEWPC